MAKVTIVPLDKALPAVSPAGFSGTGSIRTAVDGTGFPLRLHIHDLAPGEELRIGPIAADCAGYVWHGGVQADRRELPRGSSIIVERGQTLAVQGGSEAAQLLTFSACEGPESLSEGGHVHLLAADRVPRSADLGSGGVAGAIHADSDCPTCDVWLHENQFPPTEPMSAEDEARGIHSHSEDEIIFVLDGSIRLGRKHYGPGTAIAIAADTLYSFTPGPKGLSFVNFRASMPGDIKFAAGHAMSETGYWRERLPRPEYEDVAG